MKSNNTTTQIGNYFETKACEYLSSLGYNIIERNYHAKKLGEIDIISLKDDIYHFVEVKSGDSFEAVYNITPNKLYKLQKSIEYYLKVKKLDVGYCIDAIIFAGDELEYLENITL
ncbi:MAG: YraN family protein [Campylobacterota bacterium]|nr:YraN family protein [Campylobacterota bacterium]